MLRPQILIHQLRLIMEVVNMKEEQFFWYNPGGKNATGTVHGTTMNYTAVIQGNHYIILHLPAVLHIAQTLHC